MVGKAAGRGGYRDLPTATRSGAYIVDLTHITRVAEAEAWLTLDQIAHEKPAAMDHAALTYGSLRNDVLRELILS